MALFKVMIVAPHIEESAVIYAVTEASSSREAYETVQDTIGGKGDTTVFPFVLDEGGMSIISLTPTSPSLLRTPECPASAICLVSRAFLSS